MTAAPPLSAADTIALASAFAILHAAIILVPGDPKARATASVFRQFGLYERGNSPALSRRGRRAQKLACEAYDQKRAKRKRAARLRAKRRADR